MQSTGLVALWTLALALLGIGYIFAVRVETALAVQERYAESASSLPPSENPEYYEDSREHRVWVFRLGGTVLLVVGVLLLATAVYGTVFVDSVPG
jgi:uncharacterized membrane protein YiaA